MINLRTIMKNGRMIKYQYQLVAFVAWCAHPNFNFFFYSQTKILSSILLSRYSVQLMNHKIIMSYYNLYLQVIKVFS